MLLTNALLFSSLSFANAFHSFGHKHASRSLSAHQHHEPRAILDVCAYISADTLIDESFPGISLGLLGFVDVCLCLSDLHVFLSSNVNIQAVVSLLGERAVIALFTSLIYSSPGSTSCTLPRNSQRLCSVDDVCGFTCDPPFQRFLDECACLPPNTECNGHCGSYPRGCSSIVPRSLSNTERAKDGVTTLAQARQSCRIDETVCGVYDNQQGFECLNIQKTLDSCGGCTIPDPFSGKSASGVDCSALDGVDDVSCNAGRCVVKRCQDGWSIRKTKDGCVAVTQLPGYDVLNANGLSDELSPKKMRRVKDLELYSTLDSHFDDSLEDPDVAIC